MRDRGVSSVHALAKLTPSVSRSQMYLLFRNEAVMDLAELDAIAEALEVMPSEVFKVAERLARAERSTPAPRAAEFNSRRLEDRRQPQAPDTSRPRRRRD